MVAERDGATNGKTTQSGEQGYLAAHDEYVVSDPGRQSSNVDGGVDGSEKTSPVRD
jgi:hypothetical protein